MEITEKAGEEEYVGLAITPEEPIKDPVLTLEEIVRGGPHLLPASAAALGDCVVQPAKAWFHLCSPSSCTMNLNSIHLKVSPPPSCVKCLFFFSPNWAYEGLHFPLTATLLVFGSCDVLEGWKVFLDFPEPVYVWSLRQVQQAFFFGTLTWHEACSTAWRLPCGKHWKTEPQQPVTIKGSASVTQSSSSQSSSSQSTASCILLYLNSVFQVEGGSLESGLYYEIFAQKWGERNVFLVKLMDYKETDPTIMGKDHQLFNLC